MPRRYTMSQLETRCRDFADLENDDHVEGTGSGWKTRIDVVYGALFERAMFSGYRYFEYSTDITADGSASYDEPDDHLATVSLSRVIDASGRLSPPLIELNPGEESRYAGQTGDATAYQLIDDLLFLYPKPSSGTYRFRYLPQPPDLVTYADADLVDVVCPAGLRFMLHGVCVHAKAKSESDVRFHMAQQEKAGEELDVYVANRNMEGRRRVQPDVDPAFDSGYPKTAGDWNR